MKKIVTFDYDYTLELPEVQDYARHLMAHGIDVRIVTSRWDELHLKETLKYPDNSDLYQTAMALHIPLEEIYFTNDHLKADYFDGVESVIWHLDNNLHEINAINLSQDSQVVGILLEDGWMEKCNELLNFE